MTILDEPWIQTYTGKAVRILNPRPQDVHIHDIAHALANICRYTGHVKKHYSVAEHCVHVSRDTGMVGLMHDATEAYVGDVSSPLKRCIPKYKKIEQLHWLAICSAFELPAVLPKAVHEADLRMLVTEARDLMGPRPYDWTIDVEPYSDISVAVPMTALEAEYKFLERFHELGGLLP